MRHRFVAFNARHKQCVCLADLNNQYWSSVFLNNKEKCIQMLDQNENNLYEVYETGYIGKFQCSSIYSMKTKIKKTVCI